MTDCLTDFRASRPNIFQVNRFVIRIIADRIVLQIDIYRAGQCISYDKRWRSEIVSFNLSVNAAFKVTVTGKNSRDRHIIVRDRLAYFVRKRTGVTDTSCAAVAGNIETERLQIMQKPCFFQVICNNKRAWGQAAFHVARFFQAAFNCFFSEKASTKHNTRVGCVRTARNRCNNNGTSSHFTRCSIFMVNCYFLFDLLIAQAVSAFIDWSTNNIIEVFFHVRELDAVLWTFRSCQARYNRSQIQLDHICKFRINSICCAEHVLCFIVCFYEFNLFVCTACTPEICERFSINREEADGSAVFWSHVCYGRTVSQTDIGQTRAIEFNELADNAFLAEHLSYGQGQVCRRSAFRQTAGQLEADNIRRYEIKRLSQHAGFRLNAADTPSHNTEAVDHRRMGVSTYEGIREDESFAINGLRSCYRGQVLQVNLVNDTCSRRHSAEIIKCGLGPAKEAVALFVALEFYLHVIFESLFGTESIYHYGVVDNEIDGYERVDSLRIAACFLNRITHSCKVYYNRNSSKVLEDDTGRNEWNFFIVAKPFIPFSKLLYMIFCNCTSIKLADSRFKQYPDGERKL